MTTVLVSGQKAQALIKKLEKKLSSLWPDWRKTVGLSLTADSAQITVAAGGGALLCGLAVVGEDFASALSQPPLRCGLGQRADLFFSSISPHAVSICLKRPVIRPDGKIAPIQELRCRGGAGEPFATLAAAAIVVLCKFLPE